MHQNNTLADAPQAINAPLTALANLLDDGWSICLHTCHDGKPNPVCANACKGVDVIDRAETFARGETAEEALIQLASRCGLLVRSPNVQRAVEYLRQALLLEARGPRNASGLRVSSALASVKLALRELGVEL